MTDLDNEADNVRALRLVIALAESDVIEQGRIEDELLDDPRGYASASWDLTMILAEGYRLNTALAVGPDKVAGLLRSLMATLAT